MPSFWNSLRQVCSKWHLVQNLAFCIGHVTKFCKFRDCEYWCTEDVELVLGCYTCSLTCSVSLGCCNGNQITILGDFHCHHQISFLLLHSFDSYYIPLTLKNTTSQFNYNHCIMVFIPSMINHVIITTV